MQITKKTHSNKLVDTVWSKDKYYDVAGEGSSDMKHPAMVKLKEISKEASSILDMGCGEGTRLAKIADKNGKIYGIDISKKAIEIAKKKYPQFNFRVGNLEKLPFPDNTFDLVYSAFVFEHLRNPEKVIKEGVRVLKKGGSLLIAAPNFGAPNRASPPFKGKRIAKLLKGFVKDFFPDKELSWNKVTPIADSDNYEPDWDTTVEPYLGSLINYLKKQNLQIKYFSSLWSEEPDHANPLQKLFKYLGKFEVYPFKLWGPHLVVVVKKNKNV